jgi:hypothetical protein
VAVTSSLFVTIVSREKEKKINKKTYLGHKQRNYVSSFVPLLCLHSRPAA